MADGLEALEHSHDLFLIFEADHAELGRGDSGLRDSRLGDRGERGFWRGLRLDRGWQGIAPEPAVGNAVNEGVLGTAPQLEEKALSGPRVAGVNDANATLVQ